MAWPPANQLWECSGCGAAAEWHPQEEGGYYSPCSCRQRGARLDFIGYRRCERCNYPLAARPASPQQGECRCLRCSRCRGRIIGLAEEADHPKYGGCENDPECAADQAVKRGSGAE